VPLDATARDFSALDGPPIKGYGAPLTIGVHRRPDGLVAYFERRGKDLIAANAYDRETVVWLIQEFAAAAGYRVTLTRD
jgi:hypothetical protein